MKRTDAEWQLINCTNCKYYERKFKDFDYEDICHNEHEIYHRGVCLDDGCIDFVIRKDLRKGIKAFLKFYKNDRPKQDILR